MADKRIIFKPSVDDDLRMDACVDAAFACGWNTELDANPDSAKSRTGCILEVAICPMSWIAKLQPTIATSAMEFECAALSMSLCAATPLLDLAREIAKGLSFQIEQKLTFIATVHKDNQGALKLSNLEEGGNTPRSKFYALRLHWFGSWLHRPQGDTGIKFIETNLQKADIRHAYKVSSRR